MAGVAYEPVAEILAKVANTMTEDMKRLDAMDAPTYIKNLVASSQLKLALDLTEWLDDQPESLQRLYDSKLTVNIN